MAVLNEDPDSLRLQADNLLNFISDLLDFQKSPQAEAFNFLFGNLTDKHVYKMGLPFFISTNSPNKTKAMKMLHSYF